MIKAKSSVIFLPILPELYMEKALLRTPQDRQLSWFNMFGKIKHTFQPLIYHQITLSVAQITTLTYKKTP